MHKKYIDYMYNNIEQNASSYLLNGMLTTRPPGGPARNNPQHPYIQCMVHASRLGTICTEFYAVCGIC